MSRQFSEFDWLLLPIDAAVEECLENEFFTWIKKISSASDFRESALNAYSHSVTLPRVLGLMLCALPNKCGEYYELLSEHAYEEATHHLLLTDWMLAHHLIESKSELDKYYPTIETRA